MAQEPVSYTHLLSGLRNILAHLAVYMTVGLAILPQFVVVYTSFLATNGGQVFTGGFARCV